MGGDRAVSPFIVRSALFDGLRDGEAIREAALQEADAIWAEAADLRAAAKGEAATIRAEAHASGLAEGVAEAAALIAGVGEAAEQFLRDREIEICDVAFAIAHRILASLPRDETTLRLASDAIAEHGRDLHLIVRAAPGVADRLRAALESTSGSQRVTIEADPALEVGACTLLHGRGRTEIGLLAQFRALMADGAQLRRYGDGA